MNLRKKVIRLAHQRPDLRPHLLPILAKTSTGARLRAAGRRRASVSPKVIRSLNTRDNWVRVGYEIQFRYDGMGYGTIVDERKAWGSNSVDRYAIVDSYDNVLEKHPDLRKAKIALLTKYAIPDLQREGYLDSQGMPKVAARREWEYGAALRPIGMSTVPKDFIDSRKHPHFRHGTVVYDRRLTDREVKSYQLMWIPKGRDISALAKSIANGMDYPEETLELYDMDPQDGSLSVEAEIKDNHPDTYLELDQFTPMVMAELRKTLR
jgi:hypothetical protein